MPRPSTPFELRDVGDAGAGRYLAALRDHWLLIVLLVAISVGAAVAYVRTAEKQYTAQTDFLVTPVSASDPTFVGIGLLRESSDQSRSVLTAARLVKTPQVADAVAETLDLDWSRERLLNSVTVTPLGQSNIVTVEGEANDPELSADLANAFADEMLSQRSQRFQEELTTTIERLTARLNAIPADQQDSAEGTALQQRLGDLSGLVGGDDPTLQVTSRAVPPEEQVWPRPVLSIAVALLASLLLGFGLAIALELVSPKVKRDDELLLEHRLPILARVRRMPKRTVQRYLTGREPLPGDVREAYRTLRTSLANVGRDKSFPRTIVITSAIPGEGKTMTSVNLAITMALAGQRIILVDGDLRRPMVATVFNVPSRSLGFGNVLAGDATIDEALVPAPGYGDELRLLLASPEQAFMVDLLDTGSLENVLLQLRLDADVVIVDSPPLTEVADALAIADHADAVLVAVRFGRSRRDKLVELRRMLAQRGVAVTGFVVTTEDRSRGSAYTYGSPEGKAPASPRPREPVATAATADDVDQL